MKNDKRHFLFNLEWAEILSVLPAEVKYEVYDAIIEYAASGKLLDLKPMAKGCFLFIKKELDYYKDSYSEKIEKRREAGSKGGKSKQNKQKVAKQANATFAKQNKQTQANASINKNENYIDNFFVVVDKTREEFLSDFFSDSRIEVNNQLCMNLGVTPDKLKSLVREILDEWEATSEPSHENLNQAQKHLLNHLRIKINENRRKNGQNANNRLPHEQRQQEFQRHIADKLSRPYDDGPDISGNY